MSTEPAPSAPPGEAPLAAVVHGIEEAAAPVVDLGHDAVEAVKDGVETVTEVAAQVVETTAAVAEVTERHVAVSHGARVGFFLETDDFARDFAAFTERGVRFLEAPRHEPYGIVAVFEDLCGNKWDLIETKRPAVG